MTRLIAFLAITLFCTAAVAQDVGSVAVADGTVEIGRGGAQMPATVGMVVQKGDELRTGTAGQLRVVFQDNSVLNLGPETRLVIDDQVFSPTEGRFWSSIRMLQGKVRAVVSDYYRNSGASYEIETPTAVAGVRGTMFLVAYDPSTDTTDVTGIDGQVEVRGLVDRLATGVYVTPQESTSVARNGKPTAPRILDEKLFEQHLEGVDFSGVRGAGAMSGSLAQAASVATQDRAPAVNNDVVEHTLREFRDTASTLGQPESALGSRGRLGVPF